MSDNTERHQVSLEPGVWIKVRPEQVKLTERRRPATGDTLNTPPIETVLESVDGDAIIIDRWAVVGLTLNAEQVQALRDHGWI